MMWNKSVLEWNNLAHSMNTNVMCDTVCVCGARAAMDALQYVFDVVFIVDIGGAALFVGAFPHAVDLACAAAWMCAVTCFTRKLSHGTLLTHPIDITVAYAKSGWLAFDSFVSFPYR